MFFCIGFNLLKKPDVSAPIGGEKHIRLSLLNPVLKQSLQNINHGLNMREDDEGSNGLAPEKSSKAKDTKKQLQVLLAKKMKRNFKEEAEECHPQSVVCDQSPSIVNRTKKKTINTMQELSQYRDAKTNHQFEHFFEIGAKIGEGCHSTVYECIEKISGKKFAVKVIKKPDLELFASIRETYRILNRLEHDSIAKAKLLFVSNKIMTCHLVQELCEKPDLSEYILEKKKIDPLETTIILKELLSVVAYMHSQGVCHRDIKPDNIMYNPVKRKIKIIDFQLANMVKFSGSKFQLLSKSGILSFRAPESFRSIYDQKVDVWSCGIIAYLLIVGTLPFRSNCEATKIKKIMYQEPDYSQVSVWEKDLLENLLQKNPTKRVSAKSALSLMYFSVNYKNDAEAPKCKSPMVRSPSLRQLSFANSELVTEGGWERARDDSVTRSFTGFARDDQFIFRTEDDDENLSDSD